MLRFLQLILLGVFTFVVIMLSWLEKLPGYKMYPTRMIAGFIFLAVALFIYSRRDRITLTLNRGANEWRLDSVNWWKSQNLFSEKIGPSLKVNLKQRTQMFKGASITWNILVLHRGHKAAGKETLAYGDPKRAEKAKEQIEEYLKLDSPDESLVISGKESSLIAIFSYTVLGLAFILI